jgi:hypothetical protein
MPNSAWSFSNVQNFAQVTPGEKRNTLSSAILINRLLQGRKLLTQLHGRQNCF